MRIQLFALLRSRQAGAHLCFCSPNSSINFGDTQISHLRRLPPCFQHHGAQGSDDFQRSREGPSVHHPCLWAGASHQYGFRSCRVITRQSWASSLVAAVDAVPGQALWQERGGGEEVPAALPGLGKGPTIQGALVGIPSGSWGVLHQAMRA